MILTHFYKIFLVLSLFWLTTTVVSAQTLQKFGDNATFITDKAVLELESNSKGFLLPRMTKIEMETISNTGLTPEGLIVICTDCSTVGTSEIQIYTNGTWNGLLTTTLDLGLEENHILLGNADDKAEAREISGDITLDNVGVSTIGASKVLSSMILNGEIVNDDVNSDASISGTKINPNFGSQNIFTRGALDAGATSLGTLNVDGATVLVSTLAVTDLTTIADATVTGALKVTCDTAAVFTQIPKAPTAAPGTNTTQLATTEFVMLNRSAYYKSVEGITQDPAVSTRETADVLIPGMILSPKYKGDYAVTFNAQYSINPADKTAQSSIDLKEAYATLTEQVDTGSSFPPFTQNVSTISPGVYITTAAINIAADITITLNGAGTYIFRSTAGALSMGASVEIILENGAKAEDIFWVAEGAVSIGAGADIKGNLISNNGAVSLGAGGQVNGKLLAMKSGAISMDACTLTNTGNPTYLTALNWKNMLDFVVFGVGSYISHAGAGSSTINDDIGTENGSIALPTFNSSTINGEFYTSTTQIASASFSLYQNGSIIANSTRVKSSKSDTTDISLQAVATVEVDQPIDVRWHCDTGEVSLENSILTIIHVSNYD
jgi:hypothetical protein